MAPQIEDPFAYTSIPVRHGGMARAPLLGLTSDPIIQP